MRCLLVGNYGDANFGDEALCAYFTQTFPEIQWTVVAAKPTEGQVPRLPLGLRSLFITPWGKTISALRKSDAMVFGGGTLFTDTESVYACMLWCLHAAAARLFGVPRMFCVQGIGPFRSPLARWLTRVALKNAAFISVRDEESLQRARALLPGTEIVQSFDPVFSLFEAQKHAHRTSEVLIVIPRLNSGESFLNLVKECRKGEQPIRILSFQPEDAGEQRVCTWLKDHFPQAEIRPIRTVEETVAALSDAALVVTHRFHGAIAALGMGIPCRICVQQAGDKLDVLAKASADPAGLERFRSAIAVGEAEFRRALLVASAKRASMRP